MVVTIGSVNVAEVLRALAARIDANEVRVRHITVTEDHVEVDFDVLHNLGAARGSGKGS